jgi:hypothetical protein
MLSALHRWTAELESWVEDCPCHQFLRPIRCPAASGIKPFLSESARRVEEGRAACGLTRGQVTDGATFSCPMRGKRAAELASGAIAERMEEGRQAVSSELLCLLPESLSSAEVVRIVDDFNFGTAHMIGQTSLKMRHWSLLPWRLAALAHWSEDVARSSVGASLKLFDDVGPTKSLHHRISWYWLHPGSQVRAELEEFKNGAARETLPLLSKLAAELLFTPVTERCQEGQHSLVNRAVGDRKTTGPYVSLAIRTPEIERYSRLEITMIRLVWSAQAGSIGSIRSMPIDWRAGAILRFHIIRFQQV